MDITESIPQIADDMYAVDQQIVQSLQSDVVLIKQLASYIINSGGKRLRPLLLLLTARACGYHGAAHIPLATIIEFIHTATLLHDDVVDASELRRGRETANAVWGNPASVLVGDFLYSRAFEMMVDVENMRVLQILAKATNTIAEGEVLQLLNIRDPDTTEERYLRVILSKTAKLFEAAAQLGAVIAEQPPAVEQALVAYGSHLGMAFQLVDDLLDYGENAHKLGKNIGDDLAEGKPTLPLIYVLEHGSPENAACVRQAIENGGIETIDEVLAAIQATDAIAYTRSVAEKEAEQALAALATLPPSDSKTALAQLARFAVERKQ